MKIELDEMLKDCKIFVGFQYRPEMGWRVEYEHPRQTYRTTEWCESSTAALRRMAELTNDQKLLEMLTATAPSSQEP